MKTLLKNAKVVNVFTEKIDFTNVLIEDDRITGIGDYYKDEDADEVEDLEGRFLCPGFIDGHIHIESTMMVPPSLAQAVLPHGTTAVVTDPHEIANVCGVDGIKYMLEMSENIPLHVFVMIPSCVPATCFDEAGAILNAEDIEDLYKEERILGLAEMMNYPGVIYNDAPTMDKINACVEKGKPVDGHAPLLSGKDLDKYISAGINSDHECSDAAEAMEKLSKGQWIMIREGSAAKNLEKLLPLFESPYYQRCILATDDRNPADIIAEGHIDNIVRLAIKAGKDPIRAIKMATLNPTLCFGIKRMGAIACGYKANLLVLDNLENIDIKDVYSNGVKVVKDKEISGFSIPKAEDIITGSVLNSFHMPDLKNDDFYIEPKGTKCRVIEVIPGEILTNECILDIDFSKNNGIDIDQDILKLAVIERHKNTGHKGVGFIKGIGIKNGALAGSVSHDSHNLIVIGSSEEDMVIAANYIKKIGGGLCVVSEGKVLSELRLPVAGLMSTNSAAEIAKANVELRESAEKIGINEGIEPFMNMAFVSLPVIPVLKMTTQGLVNVNDFKRVDLFVE
ncbi:MAG: adenine deaminase [Lachnospiraceae bacterium]|nr:adenine deaminase [Lachnospiraceae bacterium]MBR5066777.1 adenine deaminase [Lachnospiraceae bacterium]